MIRQRSKILIFLVCLILIVMAVGTTMAFYSNKGGSLNNVVTTTGSEVYLQELFNPADHWLAGETKEKKVNFANVGERNQVIRFRVEIQEKNKSNGDWVPTTKKLVTINWRSDLENKWSDFDDDNGWYYYNEVLVAEAETEAVMESVTFSSTISNDDMAPLDGPIIYRIIVYMEALDVNSTIVSDEWAKTFELIGDTTLQWSN